MKRTWTLFRNITSPSDGRTQNTKKKKKKKKKRNSVPSELSSSFSKTKPACGSRIILLLTRANVRRTARVRSRFGLQ
jgi:hypothetical protein